MPSSLSWHPVWALPYFSPSCQGTTGSLANLDPSIDVAFVLPGVVTAEEGLGPALFPGNPGLERRQRSHRQGNRIYLLPCPTPGPALVPPPPVVLLLGWQLPLLCASGFPQALGKVQTQPDLGSAYQSSPLLYPHP